MSKPRVRFVLQAGEPPASQIVEQVERLIALGIYRGGDGLPSADALAKELGVSRVTIQKAYTALIDREIAEARVGDGTYIRSDADTRQLILSRLFSVAITFGQNLYMTTSEIEKAFAAEIRSRATGSQTGAETQDKFKR